MILFGWTVAIRKYNYLNSIQQGSDAFLKQWAHTSSDLTVLDHQDEESIRILLAEELEERGYRVITAGDGPAGLRVLEGDTRIDLLITDVGLPGGMNGRQVADAGRKTRPALKVLFVTGYAENAVVGNGLLDHGMEVVTKPFDIAALIDKVRQMIARPAAG